MGCQSLPQQSALDAAVLAATIGGIMVRRWAAASTTLAMRTGAPSARAGEGASRSGHHAGSCYPGCTSGRRQVVHRPAIFVWPDPGSSSWL